MIFLIAFRSFGRAMLEHFGCQNRPKLGQTGLKIALETIFFEKSECSRNHLKMKVFSTFLTPRSIPKRPKIVLRRPQDGLEEVFFSHRFLSSILVRFGVDFGSLWASFWEPKSVILGIIFLVVFCMSCQVRRRALQEHSKTSLRPPKIAPRGPKRALRGPQEAPRGPKEDPRGHQETRSKQRKQETSI